MSRAHFVRHVRCNILKTLTISIISCLMLTRIIPVAKPVKDMFKKLVHFFMLFFNIATPNLKRLVKRVANKGFGGLRNESRR